MKAPSTTSRILLVLAATLLIALSATLAWGVVLDYQSRGIVPAGVSVVGTDLGGMTEAQARSAIEDAVSSPMLRPLSVTAKQGSWQLDPRGIVTVDVDAMLAQAYAPRQAAPIVRRLTNRLAGDPLPAEIKPVYSIDESAVAAWIAQTASQVDTKPVNATRKIVKYKFKIKKSKPGAKVDRAAAAQAITAALSAETAVSSASREVTLPVKVVKAKIQEKDFKQAIIVSLAQCKIRLYQGAKMVKAYPCAPGRAGFPTPTGDFKVVTKLHNAPWINPGTDWAKTMPPSIPAGPSNPMGVHKIGINYPGVFMHGIPPGEFGSIGTHASHGCMRMFPRDVADLFGRVKIGTPVYIRW